MQSLGYKCDFPLAFWQRTINETEEVGIKRPITYRIFKHANCIGCLKAGKQQWYIVYCLRPDIWEKAKYAEAKIGHSILKNRYLKDLESDFLVMKNQGIEPTEKITYQKFWTLFNVCIIFYSYGKIDIIKKSSILYKKTLII